MVKIERLLFIDDDTISLYLCQTLIDELGIAREVKTFDSPQVALEHIQQHYSDCSTQLEACPDVLFVDVKMPLMDGFEFVEELEKLKTRGVDRSRFLIVLLSASLDERDRQKALLLGDQVFDFLEKPLKKEDVTNLVLKILAHSRC